MVWYIFHLTPTQLVWNGVVYLSPDTHTAGVEWCGIGHEGLMCRSQTDSPSPPHLGLVSQTLAVYVLCLSVGWLFNVPATCWCISGMDLLYCTIARAATPR